MRKIVLATRNQFKINEIKQMLLGFDMDVKSLLDFPNLPEVIEDKDTFAGNAEKKVVHTAGHLNCYAVADDSGLEVKALDNRPGVFSARYAGMGASFKDNNQKLLLELNKVADESRQAEFVCVIVCASPQKKTWVFEGRVKGRVLREERGNRGFGYDPLFVPDGYEKTFAEMELAEKNKISHRAIALKKFRNSINEIFTPPEKLL